MGCRLVLSNLLILSECDQILALACRLDHSPNHELHHIYTDSEVYYLV